MVDDRKRTDCGFRMDALEKRIDEHSDRIEKHAERLHQGDIVIDRLVTSVDRLSETIESMKPNWQQKVGEAFVFWAVPLVGGGVLWAIFHSGAIK